MIHYQIVREVDIFTRNLSEENETEDMSNEDSIVVHAYFANMPRMQEDGMGYTEFIHGLRFTKKYEKIYHISRCCYKFNRFYSWAKITISNIKNEWVYARKMGWSN